MVTMPWDKIEGSQTEPLVGRKLLDVAFGSKAEIALTECFPPVYIAFI